MALGAGDRIGPYEILGTLGAGGMGVVYRARDSRLGRELAIKFLHGTTEARQDRSRLLREARAASALNHPHICTVYDVGEHAGEAYIAMEYVDGLPIDARLPPGGLTPDTVVRHGIELTDALAHAHGRHIIHRDLKGANVVCGADCRIKILDFGLARQMPRELLDEMTRSAMSTDEGRSPAGTISWMAPELLRGEAADVRSDLWGLGVLLYELATGVLPFRGPSGLAVVSSILSEAPPPLADSVPQGLRAIIARLLEKNAARRYQSASEVRAALEAVQQERWTAPSGQTPSSPPAPPVRGRARPTRFVAAAVVIALAAGGVLWWRHGDPAITLENQQIVSAGGQAQYSPSLSPDGGSLAFVAPDAAGVPQINIQNLSKGDPLPITTGDTPSTRPRWSPKNDEILFTRAQQIWSVSPLGGTPRLVVREGLNARFSFDGARIVYEWQNRIWQAAADGSAPALLPHIPQKYYAVPAGPAFSPDGESIVYFRPSAGPNGDFWIASVAGGMPRQLTFDTREGGWPIWTVDDHIILSSARAGSRTLWRVPAAGGLPAALTTGAGEDDQPELSRDGRRLVYTNVRQSWGLMVGDAETGGEIPILEKRSETVFPQFSPDGGRLTFFGRSGGAVAIFTIGADGTAVRQLTGGAEANHMPRWSHDGAFVYFFQITPELSFRKVAAEGGPSAAVSDLIWETENFPQFDPSGRFMVFTSQKSGSAHRTLIRDLTSAADRALPTPDIHTPRWSRDGRMIAGHTHGTVGDVSVCAADGSFCRAITKGNFPMWSGDGSRIYFLRAGGGRNLRELWSIAADGSGERKLREVGPFRAIDVFFDVSAQNRIAWAQFREGRHEIWVATVR